MSDACDCRIFIIGQHSGDLCRGREVALYTFGDTLNYLGCHFLFVCLENITVNKGPE
jgi:hypothetical protein